MLSDAFAQYFSGLTTLWLDRSANKDVAHFGLHAATRTGGTAAQALARFIGKIADRQYGHGWFLRMRRPKNIATTALPPMTAHRTGRHQECRDGAHVRRVPAIQS